MGFNVKIILVISSISNYILYNFKYLFFSLTIKHGNSIIHHKFPTIHNLNPQR